MYFTNPTLQSGRNEIHTTELKLFKKVKQILTFHHFEDTRYKERKLTGKDMMLILGCLSWFAMWTTTINPIYHIFVFVWFAYKLFYGYKRRLTMVHIQKVPVISLHNSNVLPFLQKIEGIIEKKSTRKWKKASSTEDTSKRLNNFLISFCGVFANILSRVSRKVGTGQ